MMSYFWENGVWQNKEPRRNRKEDFTVESCLRRVTGDYTGNQMSEIEHFLRVAYQNGVLDGKHDEREAQRTDAADNRTPKTERAQRTEAI